MKISHKGILTCGTRATLSDKITNAVKNLFKKGDIIEPKLFGDIKCEGEFDYEFSLEFTADEAKVLYAEIRTNADKEYELLKKFKDGMLRSAKQFREFATEEIPAWQEILHKSVMTQTENEKDEVIKDAEARAAKKEAAKKVSE